MNDRPFRIALNMAGAVSAGAYTAGVLDFLVEALDAWYEARGGGGRTGVQTHDVVLEGLTGASAGGMCAAISAVALKEEFDHVRNSDPGEKANRL
jgi:predicted acylesterase/phospholipase RssA